MDIYQKAEKVTKIDKFLAATFLKLLPSWVTPNHITIFRFLSIPFVLWLIVTERDIEGFVLFVISAFSDALDGSLARTKDQITDWGKMFDPLADKLLIGSVAAILIPKYFGAWLAFAIIFVELLLILSAYYKKKYLNKVSQAHISGKIKMVFQSLGISLLIIYLFLPSSPLLLMSGICIYTGLFFALVSLLVYKSI